MNLSSDEIIATWKNKWYRPDLEKFAIAMASRPDFERFHYVCAILIDGDKESERWTKLFFELRNMDIKSPFHSPFFMLDNDSQLVMVKFTFEQDIKIWDFLRAEPIL